MNMLKFLNLLVLSSAVALLNTSAFAATATAAVKYTPYQATAFKSLFKSKINKVERFYIDFDQAANTAGTTFNGLSDFSYSGSCVDTGYGTTSTTTSVKLRLQFTDVNSTTTNTTLYSVLDSTISPPYDTYAYSGMTSPCTSSPNIWFNSFANGNFNFNYAIASTSTGPVFLVGTSYTLYTTAGTVQYDNVNAYTMNTTSGALKWPLTPGASITTAPTGYTLVQEASGIGAFLGSTYPTYNGYDVIRMAFNRVNPTTATSTDWIFVYYNPTTGIEIPSSRKTFTVAGN